MLARDRAPQVEGRFEHGGRHRFELRDVTGVAHVEERADVELAVARMGIDRPVDLVPFEDVLDPADQLAERCGRDRHILHEGDGAARALSSASGSG